MKGKGWGRIINISSRAGRDGRETIPHYSASKAAVIIFTQALAREVAREGITVNAVCPGLIWSAMWKQIAEKTQRKIPKLQRENNERGFRPFCRTNTFRSRAIDRRYRASGRFFSER